MKEWQMFMRTKKKSPVSFCEQCGEVCDASCRADALRRRERERLELFSHLWRAA